MTPKYPDPDAFHAAWLWLALSHLTPNPARSPTESAEAIEQQARFNAARVEAHNMCDLSSREVAHMFLEGIPPVPSSREWCRDRWLERMADYPEYCELSDVDHALDTLLDIAE